MVWSRRKQRQVEETARLRADIILQVLRRELTAVAGAKALGCSRKTFYKWQERGLEALLAALEDKPTGRKKAIPPDPRIAELEAQNSRLQAENQALRDQMKAQVMRAELDRRLAMGKPKKRRGSA